MSKRSIPDTINGMKAGLCISALQKMIRQGKERPAGEFAFEMVNTSKHFCSWVCNRLEVIVHEDIDAVNHPAVAVFVSECCRLAKDRWEKPDPKSARLFVGNAIRIMCRTPKSREGDHFQGAIGVRSLVTDYTPDVPDEAMDQHTAEGRRLGRGLDHFRYHGSRLEGDPPPDQYEEEAFMMWELQSGRGLFEGNHNKCDPANH